MGRCRNVVLLFMTATGLGSPAHASNIILPLVPGATTTNDGVVLALPSPSGTDAFSVSAVNLPTGGPITITADSGRVPLPVTVSVCRTNPASGACVAPPAASITATLVAGEALTFAVSVTALAPIPLDSTFHRIYASAKGSGGTSLGVTSVAIQNATYDRQLYIGKGGTYTGNWENRGINSNVFGEGGNAVYIDTTEPVVLENCFVRSTKGQIAARSGANVTIRNCHGYGLDPGEAGLPRGFFLFAPNIGSLVLEHNYLEAMAWGVALWTTAGQRSTASGPIVIRYNQVRNLDGLASDGSGGRITNVNPNANPNGFISINQVNLAYGADVAWNEVFNDPYSSATSDLVDLLAAPGTDTSPVDIHDNYFHGQYAPIPSRGNGINPANCTPATCPPTSYGTYVAQVITLDGGPADSAQTATSFVRIRNNQLVNTWGGIILGSGHDNEVAANRVVSTGQLSDGTWVSPAVDAGISSYDAYLTGPAVYYNNNAHDNIVGRRTERVDPNNPAIYLAPPIRGFSFAYGDNTRLTGCPNWDASQCINNVVLPDPITRATEDAEGDIWRQKLASNHIIVGPVAKPGNNYQGIWWNPSEPGWGINFAHQGDIIFATWFIYDGQRKPWWLIAELHKTAEGVYSGPVSTVTGPPFNAVPFAPAPVETRVGTMTATFGDATHGSLAYTVNGIAQTKAIVPQEFGPRPTCAWAAQPNPALATNYTDLWWNASESGWGINFAHQGDMIFATWFTYDANGKPWWLIAELHKAAAGVYTGGVSTVSGAPFLGVAFDSSKVVESPVGNATVTFTNGDSASFAYAVTRTSRSKAITRQVFMPPGTLCQ